MKLSRRSFLGATLAGVGAVATVSPVLSAPSSRLIDDRWTRSGDGADPDAAPWADMLARRVAPGPDGVARFDYAGVTSQEAAALRNWLAGYQAVDPATLSRPAQMAFWVNLYNAKTVDLVLEAYPVDSIRKIKGGLFNLGPWDEKVMKVAGQDLSLDDVEHGVLRPIWRDPRIHYAVNCASIGCPDLVARPFHSTRLEEMLESAARAYVAHPRGAAVEDGRLLVSSIYSWFEEDFGGSELGVLTHLSRYAPPGLAPELDARLARAEGYDDHRYDWALNDYV